MVGTTLQWVTRSFSTSRSTASTSKGPWWITTAAPVASRGTARLCRPPMWNSGIVSRYRRSAGSAGSPMAPLRASVNRWYSMTEVRLLWECTAPFGRPDVPLVNRMTAGSSPAAWCGASSASGYRRHSCGMSSARVSTGAAPPASAARLPSAMTTAGPVRPSAYSTSRLVDQALQPTVTAPTATAAQKATIQPGWFAALMATRSPGRTP